MQPLPIPSDGPYLCTDIEPGQLPAFLERAVTTAEQPQQQDMLLLSVLTACSYALPHLRLLHGQPQHTYYPNLMTTIVAPPASGKGVMNNVRLLLQPIHDRLMLTGRVTFIPANSSSAAFLTLLDQSGGQALMIETEMDVLSQTWKSDYSNYSYIFRQAYEHETIQRARMGQNGGYMEIDGPQLSVLLSGTLGQLMPLLGNQENGLTSRFLPYVVEDIQAFDSRSFLHGDRYEPNGARAVFKQLGGELMQRWLWLRKQKHDCLWSLTDEQAEVMAGFFSDGYRLAFEGLQMPVGFDASIKRMAPTIKRIGLILSALRLDMNEPLPELLYCSDQDFRTLMLLAEKLLLHAGRMILMLPSQQRQATIVEVTSRALSHADDLLALLPDTFTTAEAIKAAKQQAEAEGMSITKRTVLSYLEKAQKNKTIAKTQRGQYKKI